MMIRSIRSMAVCSLLLMLGCSVAPARSSSASPGAADDDTTGSDDGSNDTNTGGAPKDQGKDTSGKTDGTTGDSSPGPTTGKPGTGTAVGTVAGSSIAKVADAMARVYSGTADGETTSVLWLDVSDHAGLCDAYAENRMIASSKRVDVALFVTSTQGRGITAGTTYPVGNGTVGGDQTTVTARYYDLDAGCGRDLAFSDYRPKAGSITVTSISSTEVKGTYELTFANGSLRGEFGAPLCTKTAARTPVVCK